MMNKDLIAIFEYLEREKGIKREVVINAIAESLRAAARKSVKGLGEKVTLNPSEEISFDEAKILEPECQVGQWLEISITPQDFGRIAAQAARQIITQKLKGAERDVIYEEYRHRIGEIISGTVKRFIRNRTLIVDLGKVEAITSILPSFISP